MSGRQDTQKAGGGRGKGRGAPQSSKPKQSTEKSASGVVILKVNTTGRDAHTFPEWRRSLSAAMSQAETLREYVSVVENLKHKEFTQPRPSVHLIELVQQMRGLQAEEKEFEVSTGVEFNGLDKGKPIPLSDLPNWWKGSAHFIALELEILNLTNSAKSEVEHVRRRQSLYAENFATPFNYILNSVSKESRSLLEAQDSWSSVELGKDPLELMTLIVSLHSGAAHERPKTEATHDAFVLYWTLRMRESESIPEFKERFSAQRTMMQGAGCTIPDAEDQATRFRKALDMGRFGEMEKDIQNNFLRDKKLPDELSTVDKVAQYASGYKTLRSKSAAGGSAAVFVAEPEKKGKAKVKEEPETSMERRVCFGCRSPDHQLSDCPIFQAFQQSRKDKEKKKKGAKSAEADFNVMMASSDTFSYDPGATESFYPIVEAKVLLARRGDYDSNEVLSDNEATASLFGNANLLQNVRPAPNMMTFRGLGGVKKATQVGDFPPFGVVYYSPEVFVNVLSWSALHDDGYKLRYRHWEDTFSIQKPRDPVVHLFERRSTGLYSKFFEAQTILAIKNVESKYNVRDIELATEARAFVKKLGVPANSDAIRLLHHNSKGGSRFETRHLAIADDMWGKRVAALAGKSTEPANVQAKLETLRLYTGMDLKIHSDLFFVRSEAFLVSVVEPIGLVMTAFPQSKSVESLCACLTEQVLACRRNGFSVSAIFFDGEKALQSPKAMASMAATMREVGPTVESRPGVHVPKAENMVRMIKSWCRGIMAELWFKLATSHVRHLVTFVTQRINLFSSKRGIQGVPAIEAFTGKKIDLDREVKFGFGDYGHATIPNLGMKKGSIDVPRTQGVIALYNHGRDGLGVFLSLATFKTVIRTKFESMPPPIEVVEAMNKFALSSGSNHEIFGDEGHEANPDLEELNIQPFTDAASSPAVNAEEATVVDATVPLLENESGGDAHAEVENAADPVTDRLEENARVDDVNVEPAAPVDADVPIGNPAVVDLPVQEVVGHDGPDIGGDIVNSVPTSEEKSAPQDYAPDPGRYEFRRRKPVDYASLHKRGKEDKTYLAFGFNISVKKALTSNFEAAMESMTKEILQIENKGAIRPLLWSDLGRKRREAILRSFMFLKEKRSAAGIFERLKARLVANGKQQNRGEYNDSQISSPTAMLSSILMVAAIAGMERRNVVTLDVTGAYLNADMPEDAEPVDMLLDPLLSQILCKHKPEYRRFLRSDGSMAVQLTKALYGCIQSAKLWYDLLCDFLKGLGFVQNSQDECVWNKGRGRNQVTVALYVDDLLITSSSDEQLESVVESVEKKFNGVTVHRGKKQEYLGMQLDFSVTGQVSIIMSGYEADVVKCMNIRGTATTPALPDLFDIDENLPKLEKERMDEFHSHVAKILYIAKRTRPDLLLAVQFLAQRVGAANEVDWKKLQRVGKYLNGSLGLGIRYVFENDSVLELISSIDASFAVNAGAKSQSSVVILMGLGPVFTKCSKQKIVTKSSHEAELVALSDGGSQVIWSRNFLIAQGYELPATVIYQDNQATITSIKRGKPCSDRSRHVDIRLFWLGDRIQAGDIEIEYMRSEDMVADFLTKPLQGERFKVMRSKLMNWYS